MIRCTHKLFLTILLFCIGLPVCAKKTALLVGISKYTSGYNWTDINSTNDIDIIKNSLKGFAIIELRNSSATYTAICKSLDKIIKQSKSGDIVYLHFSGHGQPVEDKDGDETDGWDESFVPYDAASEYGIKGYKGEHHLIDDKLNSYIERLRKAVGTKGFVYVVFDACHSGTMHRGDDEQPDFFNDAPIRGTNTGFSQTKIYRPKRDRKIVSHYKISQGNGLGNIIIFEACAANQKNQEVNVNGKYYGPLSYSINSIIKTEGLGKTKKWCDDIQKYMSTLTKKNMSNQTMVIESSISQ